MNSRAAVLLLVVSLTCVFAPNVFGAPVPKSLKVEPPPTCEELCEANYKLELLRITGQFLACFYLAGDDEDAQNTCFNEEQISLDVAAGFNALCKHDCIDPKRTLPVIMPAPRDK